MAPNMLVHLGSYQNSTSISHSNSFFALSGVLSVIIHPLLLLSMNQLPNIHITVVDGKEQKFIFSFANVLKVQLKFALHLDGKPTFGAEVHVDLQVFSNFVKLSPKSSNLWLEADSSPSHVTLFHTPLTATASQSLSILYDLVSIQFLFWKHFKSR